MRKGYYVVPAPSVAQRDPVSYRRFAEGRAKDTPELTPLPSDYAGQFRHGLQTQTGKIEFESSSLKRFDPDDPERSPLLRYVAAWEGPHATELYGTYPLHLISPHPRHSFHTQSDGTHSTVNDIADHRALVDGSYYWIARVNSVDAAARGIADGDLVEMFNDRGRSSVPRSSPNACRPAQCTLTSRQPRTIPWASRASRQTAAAA